MTATDIRIHEPAPRDFSARLSRRAPGIATRRRKRHSGRRALALLAAVAVPAFAAPGEWRAFAVGDAGTAEVQLEPMPFERSGDSFPGSAFYYLSQEDLPPLDTGSYSDAQDAPTRARRQ